MNNQEEEKQELIDALKAYGLKQRIAELHNEIVPKLAYKETATAKVKTFRPIILKAAAVLIAIISLTAVYIFISSTSENLFNDKYVAYNIASQRSVDSSENAAVLNIFEDGQTALKNNDPRKAIASFSQILSDQTNKILHDDSEYYLALAYLKAGETDLAYGRFVAISRNENHLYHDEVSKWFLFKLKIVSLKNK